MTNANDCPHTLTSPYNDGTGRKRCDLCGETVQSKTACPACGCAVTTTEKCKSSEIVTCAECGTVVRETPTTDYRLLGEPRRVCPGCGASIRPGEACSLCAAPKGTSPQDKAEQQKAAREALLTARSRYANLLNLYRERDWGVSRAQALSDIVGVICEGIGGIRANSSSGLQFPGTETVLSLIPSLFTKTGPIGIRRTPAGTTEQRAFHRALGWHLGTGSANLGGPIMSAMMLGRERWDRIDTLACYVALIMGGTLSGSNSARWGRLLGA